MTLKPNQFKTDFRQLPSHNPGVDLAERPERSPNTLKMDQKIALPVFPQAEPKVK
jgi:hypothetical protein